QPARRFEGHAAVLFAGSANPEYNQDQEPRKNQPVNNARPHAALLTCALSDSAHSSTWAAFDSGLQVGRLSRTQSRKWFISRRYIESSSTGRNTSRPLPLRRARQRRVVEAVMFQSATMRDV